MSIMATSASIGFLGATLEPHLRQFDLSPVLLGNYRIYFIVFDNQFKTGTKPDR